METKDLRIFQAVAREGSTTKAAELLNYVQSNVTSRIQYLEAEVKVPLFHRSNRGMTLTSAGENLLKYADQILSLIDEAVKSTQYSEHPSGPLRLGSIETTAAHQLTPLLAGYHSQYPDVELSLVTGETHSLLQQVMKHDLDGAFIYGPIEDADIDCISVFEDELVFVSNSRKQGISEVLVKPLLLFEVGCSHRSKVEQLLKESGLVSYQMMKYGTLDVIVSGVSSGLGVSMLPKSSIRKAEESGKIASYPLPEPYRKLEICFVYRNDSLFNSSLEKLIERIMVQNQNQSLTK